MEPSDKERQRLAGSDMLLSHLVSVDVEGSDAPAPTNAATRIEIWQTATPDHDVQFTLMEFDDAGVALRASIFESFQTAQQWLGRV